MDLRKTVSYQSKYALSHMLAKFDEILILNFRSFLSKSDHSDYCLYHNYQN